MEVITYKNSVIIRIKRVDEHEVYFRIKRDRPLRDVMLEYCNYLKLDYDAIRFTFNGIKVKCSATADDLGLKDNDTIDAWSDQTGGGPAV